MARLTRFLLLAVVSVGAVGYSVYQAWQLGDRLILDERGHYAQILTFYHGRIEVFKWPGEQYAASAMLPGFHAVLAGISRTFNTNPPSAQTLRIYCFLISLLCVPVTHLLSRSLGGGDLSLLRAAQLYFLPLVFPLHFLLYTDVLALLFALLALLACVLGRPVICSVLALGGLLVRQNNVAFVAFLLAYTYVDTFGMVFSFQRLRVHAAKWWGLWACVAAFIFFVAVHGRIGLDNPSQHPLTISSLNLRFSLICCAALFLPWHVSQWTAWRDGLRNHPWIGIGLALAAIGLAFYDTPVHFWNHPSNVPFLLRNYILRWTMASWYNRLAVAAICMLILASLAVIPLRRGAAALLYPYWLLVLLPVWLVEPRYHILPFTLLVLLRNPARPAIEVCLLLWFIVLSQVLEAFLAAGYLL